MLVVVGDMLEPSGPEVVHVVDVVPPKGRGTPRTILFSAVPTEQEVPDAAVAY